MSRLHPCVVGIALVLLTGCQQAGSPPETPTPAEAEVPLFVDATEESGLDFVHENGRDGGFYFIEMVGGGGALFDYDNDGDLDLYLVQSTVFEPPGEGTPPAIGRRDDLHDRLLRNDLEGPGGTPRFVDVTAEAGLLSGEGAFGYGMGVATGDVDGDGWTDLYVTAFGSNVLWRNRGPDDQGRVTFEDITATAGVDDRRWSTSASFVDFDRDGRLDLYVVNYVDYDLGDRRRCSSESGRRDYCGPQNYSGEPDRLLRNLGPGPDGVTFEDVSGRAGILSEYGSGLGVVTSDFDGDGLPDLYVANDLMPNLLWRNRGDGTFVDEALLAGCAINMEGAAEASMGVDAGDFDDDGDDDLFITHLADETNTLYLNDGSGLFEDRSLATQLGAVSLTSTGFGTAMVDFDNDGWLDLVAANGAVHIIEAQARAGDPYPFDQPNQLFRNLGPQDDGEITFAEVTADAGAAFQTSEVSRGTAIGDVDNDGDADLVVVNNQGPARLLLNQTDGRRHWVGFATVDTAGRTLVGTRVEVVLDGGRTLHRRARADASYCSANDPRVLAGLGEATIERVRVTWPDGLREEFQDVGVNQYHSLVRGSGQSLEGS